MLRTRFSLCLVLFGSLWMQGALADETPSQAAPTPVQPSPAAAVSVDARALGVGEALFDYCAQNDPPGAAQVRARLKQLAQGASKEALAAARRSAEYRTAHDSEAGFLGKVDAHNAHRVCAAGDRSKQVSSKPVNKAK